MQVNETSKPQNNIFNCLGIIVLNLSWLLIDLPEGLMGLKTLMELTQEMTCIT